MIDVNCVTTNLKSYGYQSIFRQMCTSIFFLILFSKEFFIYNAKLILFFDSPKGIVV